MDSLSVTKVPQSVGCLFDKGCPGKLSPGKVEDITVCIGSTVRFVNDVILAIQHIYCNLITVPIRINDLAIEALINSSALHNFVSRSLVQHIQWQISIIDQLVVQMSDRSKAFSTETCLGQLHIGVLTSFETFYVLDSLLDMVLGMPWLCKVNSCIDQEE